MSVNKAVQFSLKNGDNFGCQDRSNQRIREPI